MTFLPWFPSKHYCTVLLYWSLRLDSQFDSKIHSVSQVYLKWKLHLITSVRRILVERKYQWRVHMRQSGEWKWGSRAEGAQGTAGTLGSAFTRLEVEMRSSLVAKPRTTEKQERIVFGSELWSPTPGLNLHLLWDPRQVTVILPDVQP